MVHRRAPFGILMSIALYFVMTRMMPPEVKEMPGGREQIRKSLAELGPMKTAEKKLLAISLTLLGFWSTEGVLHSFDTVVDHARGGGADVPARHRHHDLEGGAAADSVGHDRAVRHRHQPRHGAAADQGRRHGSPTSWSPSSASSTRPRCSFSARLSLFLIVIHLGFASATALASAMIPIVIAVLQGVATPGINIVGMTMLLQFVVSFGFILVVNAPQNMVAYGTETFEAQDFVRTGLVLTVIALALVMLLGATYWRWLGYV